MTTRRLDSADKCWIVNPHLSDGDQTLVPSAMDDATEKKQRARRPVIRRIGAHFDRLRRLVYMLRGLNRHVEIIDSDRTMWTRAYWDARRSSELEEQSEGCSVVKQSGSGAAGLPRAPPISIAKAPIITRQTSIEALPSRSDRAQAVPSPNVVDVKDRELIGPPIVLQ